MMNIGTIALASKVTVYVPSTTNTDRKADTTAHVNATASLLSNLFGGATSTPAMGYWMSNTAGLVKEKSTMVFAYCTEKDLETGIDQVVEHCRKMKQDLTQEAIAIEVNGTMYLI